MLLLLLLFAIIIIIVIVIRIADSEAPAASWFEDDLFRLLCLWLLNGLVVICVLARLLVGVNNRFLALI